MASPNHTQPPTTQPTSPPADPPTTNHAAGPTTTTNTMNAAPPQPTQIPSTSLRDSGKSRRPRDVRLIHMLLASLGVSAYQERVPLQLLDFAYRYTSNILQDAVHLTTEGYAGEPGPGGGGNKGPAEVNTVNLSAVRLSIASRLHYQFQTGLPKEFLMDMAAERNRVALPGASRGFDGAGNRAPAQQQANQSVLLGGMRLPPERFCLTGSGWTMREEWESEGEEELGPEGQEEEVEDAMDRDDEAENEQKRGSSAAAVGTKEEADEGFGEEDDEDGKMEDVFGEDTTMGQEDEDGDRSMGGA